MMDDTDGARSRAGEAYSLDERRKILLEHRYFLAADEVCAKWKITRYRLRIWKRELRYEYLIGDLAEMTVVALRNGSGTIPMIIEHLDYLNHARYSEAKVIAILEGLRIAGIAATEQGRWFCDPSHSRSGTSFIF
ncbi:MAG: hypothetical protein JWQ98_3046 [Chlorobi bacterium]|nr:hypothetical protein [Chlorobiota bacterium]